VTLRKKEKNGRTRKSYRRERKEKRKDKIGEKKDRNRKSITPLFIVQINH